MELITHTLAAGGTARFERAGRYFELIEAAGRVSVELTGPQGELSEDMTNALSGFYSEEPFAGLTISNPESYAQTVRFMVSRGRGGSRRQPGNVTVIDEITRACKVVTVSGPTTLHAFAATQIVAPASNVAGVMIRSAFVLNKSGNPGAVNARLAAAPAAPVSATAIDPGWEFMLTLSENGVAASSIENDLTKKIPAGWGLWLLSSVTSTAAASNDATVSVELL